MSLSQSLAVPAALCLVLGATPALAAGLPPDLAAAVRDYDRAQFN
jgi:hypothetical protein